MNHFNYSRTEFELLTLSEADRIIEDHKEIQIAEYEFLKRENRLKNFFVMKTQFELDEPTDLYKLPSDEETKIVWEPLTDEQRRLIESQL